MGRFKGTLGAACAAAVLVAQAAGAQGVLPDRATNVTISAPVSLPGIVLPAGTYLFRLADSAASRNVVQIFDKDRSRIYATLITVTAERPQPEGDAVITFRETAVNQAPAMRFWYYAGEKGGHEFVYPKEQAMKIAQASGESVLAVDTTSTDIEDMKKGEIFRVEATAAAAEQTPPAPPTAPAATEPVTRTEPPVAQPSEPVMARPEPTPAEPPSPVERRQAASPAPAPMTGSTSSEPRPAGTSGRMPATPDSSDSSRELPRTASPLPLIGLAGLLALGAAAGTRAFRRRLTN